MSYEEQSHSNHHTYPKQPKVLFALFLSPLNYVYNIMTYYCLVSRNYLNFVTEEMINPYRYVQKWQRHFLVFT